MNSKPHPILIAAALFLLALAVRLPKLDTYFTADEFLWVERSRNFLGGLLSPDFACLLPSATETGAVPGQGLACTLRTGHPGVVTMWTGAAGITLQWLTRPPGDARSLPDFVRDLPTNPVERRTIAPVRLPTVFLTALFVAGMYLLLRKMFRPPVPLLAGLLMALNPFHIALSRVLHHDALSTTFMLPAALSLMLYFGVERRRRWLALAGVLSGLAMLAKSTGLFLIPYAGLLGLWSLLAAWARGEATFRRALGRTLADGLLWAAIAAATFALFWPAMWVIPGQALHTIYAIGFKYASGGHAKGVFFLGNSMQDPGPLFYPVTWLFRTNLWQMAGLAAAAVALGSKFKVRGWGDALSPRGFGDHFGLLLWAAAFLFFFMLEMTLGEKKQGRYILPIYPMLDVVAAAGLAWLVRARRKEIRWGLAAAVLAVNLGLVVWSAPYYFAYYNPLAGGAPVAARAMTIGWGDGLDKAAAWLNSKPDAAALKVASWYGSTFAPYFRGETIRYSDQKGNALAGDYIVFYVNQRQRHYPDDEIWRTINDHFSLEKTIFLRSVPYAWIFPAPGIGHSVEDQTYTGIGSLLGWDWRGSPSPDDGPVAAGSALPVSVYWEYLGKMPEEAFFLRLIGPDGGIWAETTTRPAPEFAGAAAWRPGQIIEERGEFAIPAGTPPGEYALQIGFFTRAPAVPSGELTFPTPAAPPDEPLQSIVVAAAAPPSALPPGEDALDLRLLDASPLEVAAGEAVTFNLRWVAPRPTSHAYRADFILLDGGGMPRWTWPARPLIPFLPTSGWPAGVPLRTQWRLPLDDPRAPGGAYRLQLRLLDERARWTALDLGTVQIPGRVRSFTPPQMGRAVPAALGEAITLSGADIGRLQLSPGATLPVTLHWQSRAPAEGDYTVFVQLLGPDGTVTAQHDGPPAGGEAPTSTWTPGEFVADPHTLQLPDALSPGTYHLIAGMYRFETGERLPVTQNGAAADFVTLAVMTPVR